MMRVRSMLLTFFSPPPSPLPLYFPNQQFKGILCISKSTLAICPATSQWPSLGWYLSCKVLPDACFDKLTQRNFAFFTLNNFLLSLDSHRSLNQSLIGLHIENRAQVRFSHSFSVQLNPSTGILITAGH